MGEQLRIVDFGEHLDVPHQVRQVLPDLCQGFREGLMRKLAVPVAGSLPDELLDDNGAALPLLLEGDDAAEFCAEGGEVAEAAAWGGEYVRQLGQAVWAGCR